MNFLLHCAQRIYLPLWSFLVPYLLWLSLHTGTVNLKDIVMNLAGLSWLSKLYGIGHLWYVTMALMFYVLVVGLSWAPKRWLAYRKSVVMTTFVVALALQYVLFRFGIKQLYLISFLWGGAMLFWYGEGVLDWMTRQRGRLLYYATTGTLIATTFTILWVIGYCDAIATRYWIALVAGLAVIATVMPLVPKDGSNRLVSWASRVSFDVYLVHSLLREPWVRNSCPNTYVWFFVYITGAFLLAVALRRTRGALARVFVRT